MHRAQIYKLGAGILGTLPLPILQLLGSFAGLLIWLFSAKTGNVIKTNLSLAFPELSQQERAQLVRATAVETGKMIFENFYFWTRPQEKCLAHIKEVEGLELARTLLEKDQGLILVLPHIGNWELLNHFLGKHFALVHMHQPASNKAVDQLIQHYRAGTGTQFTAAGTIGIRHQLKSLRRGKTIGLMPDQEPDINTGEFAKFFGVDCLTGELAGKLSAITGARLVTVCCLRRNSGQSPGGFKVVFDEIESSRSESSAAQITNYAIERVVRKAPDQYLWSYKRFRTRPLGQPELYAKKQHPVSRTIQLICARSGFKIASFFPIEILQKFGEWCGRARMLLNTSSVRITRKNLLICQAGLPQTAPELLKASLVEASKSIFERGLVWHCADDEFDMHCLSVEGLEYLPERNSSQGVLVLTPSLGHREVLMRYLGRHYKCADYYQPHHREAMDEIIRQRRTAMGIALLSRSGEGEKILAARLLKGDVVTFCPDQQPRLRGGEFVPFFGEPALTDKTLARLIRDTNPCLVFGAAVRERRGFRLHLERCELDSGVSDSRILTAINKHLEKIICSYPEQFEWEEKRFNIRPRGSDRIY